MTTTLLNDLQARTYHWKSEALARWLGQPPPEAADHRGADGLLLTTLDRIDTLEDLSLRHGLRHRFIDLYLQDRLRPYEAEMQVMTQGAAAHVNGHKIYLREVIPWCQQIHTWEERQLLQGETSALCRFLKPYVLAHWEESLTRLREDFGYSDYARYCGEKKAVDYAALQPEMNHLLESTRGLYFDAMTRWCQDCFGRPLADLTRFDAIHLLGWGGFPVDAPASPTSMETLSLSLLDLWEMPLAALPGLHLHTRAAAGEAATQAMTFLLRVPQEIHVVMVPAGGWIDLETLWHELGHGLAAAFTPATLSPVAREFATDHSLSEGYAFLLQGAVLSEGVLTEVLGLDGASARRLVYFKTLRDLAVFRRYAARFLWELQLFNGLDLADGEPYAELMRYHTGFYHQPESHLFDLTAEFYCCDYLRGMLMARGLAASLEETLGSEWPLTAAAGGQLRSWWAAGHTADMTAFCAEHEILAPHAGALMGHWEKILAPGPPP